MDKITWILVFAVVLLVPLKLSTEESNSRIDNFNSELPIYNFGFQTEYLRTIENSLLLTEKEIARKQAFGTMLNLLVGFGSGSFYQGDLVTGTVALISDITTVSLFGLALFLSEWQFSMVFFTGSVIIGFVTRLYQIIAPSYFADVERVRNGIPVAWRTNENIDFLVLPAFHQDPAGKTWQLEGAIAGATYRF